MIDRTNAIKKNKELRLKRIENYNLNPKLCKFCGNPFSYDKRRNKYCNHSCSAKFVNKDCRRHENPPKRCIDCNKKIYDRYGDTKRCKNCEKKYRILNGIYLSHGSLRKYLKETRGYRCERCKNTHWQGELIPLDVHHIDGNRKNNKQENLLLLCKNCHGITKIFGYKNIKNLFDKI